MRSRRFIAVPRALALAVAVAAAAGATASAAGARTLYVADTGNNANPCAVAHPCKTIGRAVGVAKPGDTIMVEKGTYHQDVLIGKTLHLVGVGHPVDNARGRDNGFVVQGPKAAGTTISGFIVKNAAFEGIVVKKTSHVTIQNNLVTGNDQGLKATKPVGECAPNGGGPGDCGEGIHLISAKFTNVIGNVVKNNAGGILLTDEFGPATHNLISRNSALNNVLDCGITVAGHNPKGGGITNNAIINNIANGNGTKGEGAGILLAAGAPGDAVANNLIAGNTANNNGIAGITIHSHSFGPNVPPGNLNGNRITNNKLSHDGVADKSEAEFGENDGKTSVTVGILVGSDPVKLKGIVIRGNRISNTHYGIYTKNVPPIKKSANKFNHVAVPLKQV
jgi:parallel beta-helix repeat protein